MIVNTKKLYEGQDHFNYTNDVELEIAGILQTIIGRGDIKMSPRKYFEGYDFCIGECRFELKISSLNNSSVEYSRADDTPSGLSKTRADYYVFINPSKLKDGNSYKNVFKMRIVDVMYLRSVKDSSEKIIYPRSEKGPGAKAFIFDFKLHEHIWGGTFEAISNYEFNTQNYTKGYGKEFNDKMRILRSIV